MFLTCSTSNQVATVLQLFLNAVRHFGLHLESEVIKVLKTFRWLGT